MSQNQTKVLTVSVAAYNAEKYLREVLNSFEGLDNIRKLEIFVIDDGGTDSSYSIAKEYEQNYPGIVHAIHKDNGGWGSTVNYSINHATGKYFKILDGDDFFVKENLDDFIDFLDESDTDIVISPYVSFLESDYKNTTLFDFNHNYTEKTKYDLNNLPYSIPLAMHSFAVKTNILQNNNIQLKEHCLYRDMEFTAKVIVFANTISFYENSVYSYRLGRDGQSVSKSSYIKHIDEHADIVYSILEISKAVGKGKKELLYELANGACTQQYNIYFYSTKTENVKKKLVEFDKYIKQYTDFYPIVRITTYIKLLRKTNFIGYHPIMMLVSIKRFFAKTKD